MEIKVGQKFVDLFGEELVVAEVNSKGRKQEIVFCNISSGATEQYPYISIKTWIDEGELVIKED